MVYICENCGFATLFRCLSEAVVVAQASFEYQASET